MTPAKEKKKGLPTEGVRLETTVFARLSSGGQDKSRSLLSVEKYSGALLRVNAASQMQLVGSGRVVFRYSTELYRSARPKNANDCWSQGVWLRP